jgi:hypothetical protein
MDYEAVHFFFDHFVTTISVLPFKFNFPISQLNAPFNM